MTRTSVRKTEKIQTKDLFTAEAPDRQGPSIHRVVNGEAAVMVREAANLRRKSPNQDATMAASNDDFRYVGVAGFGLSFPGLPNEPDERSVDETSVREILRAGDAADEYWYLYRAACYDYAEQYNRTILRLRESRRR